MKITSKGQVTIPNEIRQKAGLRPDTEVEFIMSGKKVYIHKAGTPIRKDKSIVDLLRGKGSVRMTTDQIMALTRGEV